MVVGLPFYGYEYIGFVRATSTTAHFTHYCHCYLDRYYRYYHSYHYFPCYSYCYCRYYPLMSPLPLLSLQLWPSLSCYHPCCGCAFAFAFAFARSLPALHYG